MKRRLTDYDKAERVVARAIGCVNDEQCTAKRGPAHCRDCLEAAQRAIAAFKKIA
jgi:hypothetical protein